jgi:hypothetical protein
MMNPQAPMTGYDVRSYDPRAYPFAEIVATELGCGPLAGLHATVPGREPFDSTEAQRLLQTRFHASVMPVSRFMDLYRQFATGLGMVLFAGDPFLRQRVPTLRVQLPDAQAVSGQSHRDGDHNHPDGEVNVLIPLTRMFATNTLFLESRPGRGDYRFVELEIGQVLVFDGRNCAHGNVANRTGVTRVSLDFRLLPRHRYDPDCPKRSVVFGLRFVAGEYYDAEIVAGDTGRS